MNILILGCGEVGQSCAHLLRQQYAISQLTLHCKSPQRQAQLQQAFSGANVEHFDIFSVDGTAKLSALIEHCQPDYIIDCLPVGNILVPVAKSASLQQASMLLFDYFRCLQSAFDQGVKRIQKVSSGGAGGLGLTCPYRHGLSSSNNSDALLWKIYFNGALHQLLINLHESAGASVGLTIPRALIGYETTEQGHIVGCGDGTLYTRTELELCASPSQFGFITKEAVAQATLASLFSTDFSHDLISHACTSGVNQTQASGLTLHNLTEQMAVAERQHNSRLISLGSLGNQVTKDMIELLLAIELANDNYDASSNPEAYLLAQGYFSAELLTHFSFVNGSAATDDRQIDHSHQHLTQWQQQLQTCCDTTPFNEKDVGRFLAAIYQQRGIDKK